MDLLSAASGIITLLGVGGTIVKGLERLSSLREAPNIILALNNEVSDFRIAILELRSILQQGSASSTSQAYNDNLDLVLWRARDKLVELECLIEYRLLAPVNSSKAQLNKTAWILEKHRVKRIQEEIRSIRVNLITALGILNNRSLSRIQVRMTDMCLISTGVQEELEQARLKSDINFHLIQAQLTQLRTRGTTELHSHGSVMQQQESSASLLRSKKISFQRQAFGTITDVLLSDSSRSRSIPALLISSTIHQHHFACKAVCTCRCHRIRSWKSPRCLQSLLGLLFTGYVGIPFLSPSCDNKFCQYRSEPTATVHYYFPPWFANQVLQFCIQLSKLNGITQSLRIYRVIWSGSELMRKSIAGDLEGVRAILASRQGSPFDITRGGFTALAHAVIRADVGMSQTLIQAGADPYHVNVWGKPILDYVWVAILSETLEKETSKALQTILPAPDLADYEFTPLHLAVLGLSTETVEEALCHSSFLSIDIEDGFGRTALWWAARRSDYHAMKFLIHHHADVNKADRYGIQPVHATLTAQSVPPTIIARSKVCLRLLLESGIDINQRDGQGLTPLLHTAYLHNDTRSFDLLIQHNPNLDIQALSGVSALLAALEYQHYDIAARLIQTGADIHLKENSGYNALSLTILFNAHSLVQELLDRQADHHGHIEQYGTLLHLVAEAADTETLQILTNTSIAARDVQVRRSDGQTAMDVARARTGMTVEWQNALYAFIYSVDETKKTLVSPSRSGDNQGKAEESNGEGDVFHDALE